MTKLPKFTSSNLKRGNTEQKGVFIAPDKRTISMCVYNSNETRDIFSTILNQLGNSMNPFKRTEFLKNICWLYSHYFVSAGNNRITTLISPHSDDPCVYLTPSVENSHWGDEITPDMKVEYIDNKWILTVHEDVNIELKKAVD